MANKDFLSQFSTNNKPDSFKEEERIPVENNKKKISPKIIIIGIISLIVIGLVVFLLFFMPKIKVESFVGMKKEDAVAWIRQQGIESSGILFKEEYDFDNENGVVLSQEPTSGKVTNKAKMTFVISKGPDPDESVAVPDFKSMDKEAITNWIQTNKLLSTKLNTTYSDDVEKDEFIKADYSGCDEDTFTRGCTLKITISKGAKPEEEISMVNFVDKSINDFQTWANSKKLKLDITEVYSETKERDIVISQSAKENEKVKSGDTIYVTVSKGKGVMIPDFAKMSERDINDWLTENQGLVKVTKKYSPEGNYVLEQSASKGTYIDNDNKLKITLNLGNSCYLSDIYSYLGVSSFVGQSYDKLKDWADQLEDIGIHMETYKDVVDSTKPKTEIISISIWDGNDNYSEIEKLPLSFDVHCSVSSGLAAGTFIFPYDQFIDRPLSTLLIWNRDNSNYYLTIIDKGTGKEVNDKKVDLIITSIEDCHGELVINNEIPYGSKIYVTLSEPKTEE